MTNFQKKILYFIFFIFAALSNYAQTFDFTADVTQGCTPLQIVFKNTTDISYRYNYTYQWTVEPSKFSTESDTVYNTYITPGTYSIIMKVFDSNLQLVSTVTKPDFITAFRDPDVYIQSDKQEDCELKPFQFSIDSVNSEASIVEYTWIISDGTSYSGMTPPPHYFTFADDFQIFVAVRDANGCTNRIRNEISVKTYDDYPIVDFSANNVITCQPTLAVNFTNNTPSSTYTSLVWDFGDGVTSTVLNPSHTYNGFGNYIARLSATSANNCTQFSTRQIRLIDFQPDFTITDGIKAINSSNKACPGVINFTDASTPAGTISFAWDLGNNGSTEANTRNYTTSIASGGTYQMKYTAGNGICTKSITKTFEVEPPLNITYSPTDLFICEPPSDVLYSAVSNVPGTTFNWEIADSNITGNNFIFHFEEGTFSDAVYATSPNGCVAHVSKTNNVEVTYPHIDIFPIGYVSGCTPVTATFDYTSSYLTSQDFIEKYRWDFESDGIYDLESYGPVSHTYIDTGVYKVRVQLVTNKGCKKTSVTHVSEDVKVGLPPSGNLIISDTVLCANVPLSISFVPDDNSRYTTMYDTLFITAPNTVPNRYFIPSSNLLGPTVNYSTTLNLDDSIGYHTINYLLSDHGCRQNFNHPDSVRVKGPIVDISSTLHKCESPYMYTYRLSKKINVERFYWYMEKISGANTFSPKIVGVNEDTLELDYNQDTLGRGIYNVFVRAYNDTDGCFYNSPSQSTIVTDIIADFTLGDSIPCYGDTAQFIMNKGQDIYDAYWYHPFQTPNTWKIQPLEDSVFYVFNSNEIRQVTVICRDYHNCYDTISKPVKVYMPLANFYADIVSDCLPFESNYTDSTISDTVIVSREWNFGNGEVLHGNITSYTTEYNSEGLTTPSLIVTDILGCKDTIVKNNYIRPVVPNTRFTVANPKVCLNHDAMFVRNTTDPNYDNNIHRYSWDFGDGSSDSGSLQDTVRHTYTQERNPYTVKLTAYSMSPEGNECKDSTTGIVEVKDVNAKVVIGNMDLCKQPGQKFIVYLQNSWYSPIRYTTVNWSKIDGGVYKYIGNSQGTRVFTFDNYGEQKLILKTTSPYYGCERDSLAFTVDVPGYSAAIVADKDEVCVREDVTFHLVDTSNIYRYNKYWEFGDGTTNNTDFDGVTHAYTSLAESIDDTYKIQFIVDAPNCLPQDISTYVKVFPVIADFNRGELDTDTVGCAPYELQFFNESEGASTLLWDFGDGTTSTQTNPTHVFPKSDTTYTIRISVTSNICNDFIEKPISTHPNPDIHFDLDTSICVGSSTNISATGNFSNLSWSPASYFANPLSANTSVTPTESGFVTANVQTQYNCPGADSVFIYVQQKPKYLGAPDSLLLYYFTPDSLRYTSSPDANLIAGQMYNVNNTKIEGIHYSWSPTTYLSCSDCPSPDINLQCGTAEHPSCIDFPEYIQYTVYMTDTLGCFEEEQVIKFPIVIETKAALPKAFTPNDDGDNDFAFVRGWGIKEFLEVRIYNRWGQLVFSSNDINIGWDGTYKSEPQPMDTYAYTIRYVDSEDNEQFIKGYITLLR